MVASMRRWGRSDAHARADDAPVGVVIANEAAGIKAAGRVAAPRRHGDVTGMQIMRAKRQIIAAPSEARRNTIPASGDETVGIIDVPASHAKRMRYAHGVAYRRGIIPKHRSHAQ